jgi:metal-sulfur cluster biosynthetic enzyme
MINHEDVPSYAELVEALREVHDPEIPINIFDLGLVRKCCIDVSVSSSIWIGVHIVLTNPNCPVLDRLLLDIASCKTLLPKRCQLLLLNIEGKVLPEPWSVKMMTNEG